MSSKASDKPKRKLVLHSEECNGCMMCMMACSEKYSGKVSPREAHTKVVRKGGGNFKLYLEPECTRCGRCVEACEYGARELRVMEGE